MPCTDGRDLFFLIFFFKYPKGSLFGISSFSSPFIFPYFGVKTPLPPWICKGSEIHFSQNLFKTSKCKLWGGRIQNFYHHWNPPFCDFFIRMRSVPKIGLIFALQGKQRITRIFALPCRQIFAFPRGRNFQFYLYMYISSFFFEVMIK